MGASMYVRSCFGWPQAGDAQGKVVLSHEELGLLIAGIDLNQVQRRPWYRQVTDDVRPTV